MQLTKLWIRARRQVKRLVDVYQKLLKNKKKDQPKANKDRESFLADLIYEQALGWTLWIGQYSLFIGQCS